jgi:signal transduction histidine kinase
MSSAGTSQERPALIAESTRLGIAFAHDIIVFVHHGTIVIDSEEGQYLELKITLPKEA